MIEHIKFWIAKELASLALFVGIVSGIAAAMFLFAMYDAARKRWGKR